VDGWPVLAAKPVDAPASSRRPLAPSVSQAAKALFGRDGVAFPV